MTEFGVEVNAVSVLTSLETREMISIESSTVLGRGWSKATPRWYNLSLYPDCDALDYEVAIVLKLSQDLPYGMGRASFMQAAWTKTANVAVGCGCLSEFEPRPQQMNCYIRRRINAASVGLLVDAKWFVSRQVRHTCGP